MAWQRENVFHMGKRYKGKRAKLICEGMDEAEAERLCQKVIVEASKD